MELNHGQHLATVPPSFGQSMATSFSPGSMLLATADNDTTIRVYDARTGHCGECDGTVAGDIRFGILA